MSPMHPLDWSSPVDLVTSLQAMVQDVKDAGAVDLRVGDRICGIIAIVANSSTCIMGVDDPCARQVLAGRRVNWL